MTTTPTEFDADEEIVSALWPLAKPQLANPDDLDGGTVEQKTRAIGVAVARAQEQVEQYGPDAPRQSRELIERTRVVTARARPQLNRSIRSPKGPDRYARARFALAELVSAEAVSAMDRETASVLDLFLDGRPCSVLLDDIETAVEKFDKTMSEQYTSLPRDVARQLATELRREPMPSRRIKPGDSNITRGPRSYDRGRITVPASGPGAMDGAR